MTVPVALTVAGSDSGGGAGIQADLKTFAAFGVYGLTVITAVTAQNTLGVRAVQEIDPAVIASQLDAVAEDFSIGALKTGMLSSAAIIESVADGITRHELRPLVVDPVMVAKSGDRLLRPEAVEALRRKLLPMARLVTPNIPEAEVLAGRPIRNREDRVIAARRIMEFGAHAVVIKGGHSEDDPVVDVLQDGRAQGQDALVVGQVPHPHPEPSRLHLDVTFFMNLGGDLPYTKQYNLVDPQIGYTQKAALDKPVRPGRPARFPHHGLARPGR